MGSAKDVVESTSNKAKVHPAKAFKDLKEDPSTDTRSETSAGKKSASKAKKVKIIEPVVIRVGSANKKDRATKKAKRTTFRKKKVVQEDKPARSKVYKAGKGKQPKFAKKFLKDNLKTRKDPALNKKKVHQRSKKGARIVRNNTFKFDNNVQAEAQSSITELSISSDSQE